jgi:hypothetical protein
MNENIKEQCLRLLQHPEDKLILERLIEVASHEDPASGARLRDFVDRGAVEPHGFILSNKAKELILVPYVVVRVMPLHLAVRFACECAEKVLPLFEQAHPNQKEPRELVELVKAWTEKKATKKVVKDKLSLVQVIATKIDKEWHRACAEDGFSSLPKGGLDLTNRPLFAIDVVLANAGAVVAPSKLALSNVDEAANKCIEAEAAGGTTERDRRVVVRWMIKRLHYLVIRNNHVDNLR